MMVDTVLRHENTLQIGDSTYQYHNAQGVNGIHYLVTQHGCDSIISVSIRWQIEENEKFPEAITPNGDGINDVFIVPPLFNSPGDFPHCQLVIFNRYGQARWHSGIPYQNDWGGMDDNGQPLPAGTYIWIFYPDAKSSNVRKGNITIVR